MQSLKGLLYNRLLDNELFRLPGAMAVSVNETFKVMNKCHLLSSNNLSPKNEIILIHRILMRTLIDP